MAIAHDADANGGNGGTSWNHTCTGSDLILFVAATSTGGTTPTATYNSVSMTRIDSQNTGTSNYKCSLFYLVGPATGTHSVQLTNGIQGCSVSYTGAHQFGIPSVTNKGSNSVSSLTLATVSTIDLCWVVEAAVSESSNSSSQSAGASTTQRTTTGTLDSSVCGMYDNNAAKTPAGSVSLIFTQSDTSAPSRGMAAVSCAFAPVQAPVTININDTVANGATSNVSSEPGNTVIPNQTITQTDTNVTTETSKTKYGFGTQSKSSTTWSNQSKS